MYIYIYIYMEREGETCSQCSSMNSIKMLSWFQVWGLRFRVSDFGFGLGLRVSMFRVKGSGFRGLGSGFRVQGLGFRV